MSQYKGHRKQHRGDASTSSGIKDISPEQNTVKMFSNTERDRMD